jgi:hypothetical protein
MSQQPGSERDEHHEHHERDERRQHDDGSGGEKRYHDECYACPVGSLFMSMNTASPDMMEHLLAAAHELLQVARSAIDAAEVVVERQREGRSNADRAEPRVHRIDLD